MLKLGTAFEAKDNMKKSPEKDEYQRFNDALTLVLSVPRAKMVAMLAEEKEEKARKKSRKNHQQLVDAIKESLKTLEGKEKPRRKKAS